MAYIYKGLLKPHNLKVVVAEVLLFQYIVALGVSLLVMSVFSTHSRNVTAAHCIPSNMYKLNDALTLWNLRFVSLPTAIN